MSLWKEWAIAVSQAAEYKKVGRVSMESFGMTEARAAALLDGWMHDELSAEPSDLSGTSGDGYINWDTGSDNITLDGGFSVELLEAIIFWMKYKKSTLT